MNHVMNNHTFKSDQEGANEKEDDKEQTKEGCGE